MEGFGGTETSQQDQQRQLTQAQGSSQRLRHQLRSMDGLDLGLLHICGQWEV